MTTIPLSKNGNSPFQQLIGYDPEVMQKWTALEEKLFSPRTLPKSLLEEVRKTLAFGNQCKYCMAKGKPKPSYTDKRELLATAFADLFVKDVESVSKKHFEILQEEFTDAEISHLCSFISFLSASQKLGRIFNLEQ